MREQLPEACSKPETVALIETMFDTNNTDRERENARERLVGGHLRLIGSIAREFARKHPTHAAEDVIQTAREAFIEAVNSIDPARAETWASAATTRVRRAIWDAHIAPRTVPVTIPRNYAYHARQVVRGEREARTNAQHAALSALTAHVVPSHPVDDGTTDGVQTEIVSPIPSPFEQAANMLAADTMRSLVATLPELERAVIEYRFGYTTGDAETIEAAATYFNIAPDRVRALERFGFARLAHPSRSANIPV